jgi:glycoside/pentoside/hexuronide:cation symporter, GPH family
MKEDASAAKDAAVTIDDRVPIGQKIAYGLGVPIDNWGNWLYPNLIWPVFNLALGVPPWLISAALFMNRIFDALSDPFFGWWSDNTRTRWGRRRPFILVGGILAGVCLPLLFWVTPGWGSTTVFGQEITNYFWYMVISSAFYITIVSSANVPYQSLANELTPSANERTSVYAFRTGIQKVLEIALFAGAAFVTATAWKGATTENVFERFMLLLSRTATWFGEFFGALFTFDFAALPALFANQFGWLTPTEGELNTLLGAKVYTIILGAMMVGFALIVFFFVKERYYQSVVTRKQERVKLSDTVWKVLGCRPFRAQLAMGFAYAMGTSMVGTLGYYATIFYVCNGDQSVGGIWNFWMGAANSVFGFFGVPIFATLANKFGKKPAMVCVQTMAVLVFIGTWWLYDPSTRWLQIFASGLIAFTAAGFWMLYGSIGADVMDFDELEHGKRREGAFAACGMWIMKLGQATGIGFSGVVLSATGFDQALGANQTPGALFNIRLFLAVIPIVGLVVAYFFLQRYSLSAQKMAEIRTQLEARRGKV